MKILKYLNRIIGNYNNQEIRVSINGLYLSKDDICNNSFNSIHDCFLCEVGVDIRNIKRYFNKAWSDMQAICNGG